ncbi:MAG TPA: hypothetical protein VHR66_32800 [Gemmataceae bacterium]|nr:hypothetical protein [Gemmataceae bacterium]
MSNLRASAIVAAGLLFVSTLNAQAPPPPPPAPAGDVAQELTRGPIHEAFGQPTAFNPAAGVLVAKRPPELIEEVPPDQRPAGENVAWMPGYWQFDDESKNFVWVSGFWRNVPPGRTWVPGYWNTTDQGYQWVSGYWMAERTAEVEYLPPPPETIEAGPSTEAVDANQVWIPGCWVWHQTRFQWRPGFWSTANPDWVWTPAHYEYTPSGYLFVEGYWDYPLLNRGLLFAPVAFTSVPIGFVYTPSVVIDARFLAFSLFAGPIHSHYYFGDYYDPRYARAGIYPWFAFHNSRIGYDPIFAQTNFIYSRRDPQWSNRLRETYFDRREHEAARPPHTYRQFNEWARKTDPDGTKNIAYVHPLAEISKVKDYPVRLERVDPKGVESVRAQATQVRKFREERMKVEQEAGRDMPRTGAKIDPAKPVGRTAAARVKMPEAPRLSPSTPGVGGPGKTPPVGTAKHVAPPETPRVPDLTPPNATPKVAPKSVPLPHPEEHLKLPPVAKTPAPPAKVTPPVAPPPPKKKKEKD